MFYWSYHSKLNIFLITKNNKLIICKNYVYQIFKYSYNQKFLLCRLWAEVFHVAAGSGQAKWQQVSEDLVPVNITCIQDSPECVFHITAYNSQVDKILDVRLVQPGKFSFICIFFRLIFSLNPRKYPETLRIPNI